MVIKNIVKVEKRSGAEISFSKIEEDVEKIKNLLSSLLKIKKIALKKVKNVEKI